MIHNRILQIATTERILQNKTLQIVQTWTVAILLVLGFPVLHRSQSESPNLKPFQPEGWSDALVISDRLGNEALQASDRLYVDFAVINSGGSPVTVPFRINLFVDDRLRESFDVFPPLDPQVYRFLEDYPIGRLDPGIHTVRVVADAGETVLESDEADNEYIRTILVGASCLPLSFRVSPQNAGTVTLGREPNCGGATVSTLAVPNESPRKSLGIGGEPIVKARKARAFATLRGKVRSENRVRVIVGLRTGSGSAAVAVDGPGGVSRRPAGIARAQESLMIRMSSHRVSSIRRFKFMPYVALEVDAAALEALAADREVLSIEEDQTVKPMLADSTSLIGAPRAWSQGYAGAGQTVAVLDTGVDGNHPFLTGKVVSEACYSGAGSRNLSLCPGGETESTEPGSGRPCPSNFSDCFHGTSVAGIAAGYGTEFSGVARDARIIAIQVFSQCGGDCLTAPGSDLLAGLERVLELSASLDIAAVNISLGGALYEEKCDADFPAVKAAMDNLRAAGIATIVAAGNESSSTEITFPSCISSAISVGSTDGIGDGTSREAVSDFSNSSHLLDLLAPGREINTSVLDDGFRRDSGTSFSAPHVAGAWAVLKSKAANASIQQLFNVLSRTGIPINDPRNELIKPRIQLDAAVDAVVPPISYSRNTRLTLTAAPHPGYRFTLWRGCDDSAGNRCVVAMNAAKNVTAVFAPLGTNHPDLITTSLTAPSTAAVGSDLAISAGIRNQGATDAGTFRLGFYLSEDPDITIDDIWFAACAFNMGLAAGRSEACRKSFPIPQRIVPGRYYLGALVDDLDRVAERSETNNVLVASSGPIDILAARLSSRSFVPVILSAEGRNNSFFTSELILTNRGTREARLNYTYTADAGGGSGTAIDVIVPGRQKIESDAFDYLRRLGVPVGSSGNRIGTLAVEAPASAEVGIVVRTTTVVPEGRAGLAYSGITAEAGFHHEPVYLCGLRQNSRDRSNVAFQNMGEPEEGAINLRTTVYPGDASGATARELPDVWLEPGEFHQYSGLLGKLTGVGGDRQGYVKVMRVAGEAPFYAYGVINDQRNSDGSFVFPVTGSSLVGPLRQTLPVIVETGEFTSELTVTNFSGETKTLHFRFVADRLTTPDRTARFTLTLEHREQRIIPDVIHTEMRRTGVTGVPRGRGGLAGALFATVEDGDMRGIVIGARTSASDGRGGQYGVFYNAVPDGAAFTNRAWVDGLQQDAENRSNLALVNTGEVDETDSVFSLDIYDGETSRWVGTITRTVPAMHWHQINGILSTHGQGAKQGYVRIRKTSGNNPFLAYGVVNDGGAPRQRSGDGAYVPGRK